jgi:hypothetical protein
LAADYEKYKPFESQILSSTDLSTSIDKIHSSAEVATNIETTLLATISHIEGADISVSNFGSLTAVIDIIKQLNADLTVESLLTSTVNITADHTSSLQSTTETTIDSERDRGFTIFTDAVGVIVAVTAKVGAFFINAETETIFAVDADKTTDVITTLTVDSNTSILGEKYGDLAASLDAQLSLNAVNTKIKQFDIASESNFASNIAFSVFRSIFAPLVSNYTLIASLKGPQQTFRADIRSKLLISANGSIRFEKPWLLNEAPAFGVLTTSDKKFGTASVVAPGQTGQVAMGYYASQDVNADASVFDYWIKPTGFMGSSTGFFGILGIVSDQYSEPQIIYLPNTSNNILGVIAYNTAQNTGVAPTLNQWNHIALALDNTSARFALWLNGTRIAYHNGTFIRPQHLTNIRFRINFARAYLDEVNVSSGPLSYLSDIGRDPESTTITVPTAPGRRTENTLLLAHYDNNFDSDVTTQHFGSASVSSEFALYTRPADIIYYDATLTVNTSLSCDLIGSKGIELTAFSNANINLVPNRIKQFNADLSINTSVDVINDRIKSITDNLASTVDLSVIGNAIAEGTILLEISTGVSADVNITAESQSLLESTTSQTAIGRNIYDVTVNVDSLFSPLMTVEAIRNSFAILDSVSSLSINATKTTESIVDLDSQVSTDAVAVKLTDIICQTDIVLSSTVISNIVAEGVSNTELLFSLDSQLDRFRYYESNITAETNQSIINERIRYSEQSLTVICSLNADGREIDFQKMQLDSIFEFNCISGRLRDNDIVTESVAITLSVVAVTTENSIEMASASTLAVDARKFVGYTSDLTGTSTLDLTALRIQDSLTDASSEFTLDAIGRSSTEAAADLFSSTSLSAIGVRGTEILLQAFTNAGLTLDANVIREVAIEESATTELSADFNRTRNNAIELLAFAAQLTLAGKSADAIALTLGTFSLSVNTSIVHIQEYVWKVPRENRTYRISTESRLRTISGETRYYKVY